ncbi:TM2 domain-containing protein [Cereibacter sphaeroides]|uniref:TM2 domain-containing protein n=1 Tax=Rhodobacterales TaxID=204455 RepID=UPI000BBEE05D|nr:MULTISPECIES: TM2 domain-containing protein [Paracoccaceae]MCE6951557.1 TM2 domain-containing protein [Cereibacter sphaeroides]MCE6959006.1 TM2 domain-containing protein [Cereibacter sphaeroides]MCE6969070.1 TM2 domain-containing protein [Cereibacter sphaeroides]MCE6973652.1 TM2 domain-containing protein [Cereibacter sphaeroides]
MALTVQQQMLVEQRLANDKKSTLVAYLLWFFTGGLGGHRFYLGRTGSAVGMIALTVLGLLTSVIYVGLILLVIVGIWVLVDAFLIPGMIESLTRDARVRISDELAAMATAG